MCTASVLWPSTHPGSLSVCLSNVPLSRAWPELSLGPLARLSSFSHSIATAGFRSNTHSRFSESMPQGPLHLLQVAPWGSSGSTCPSAPILRLFLALVLVIFPFSNKKYTYNIPQDEVRLHLPCILLGEVSRLTQVKIAVTFLVTDTQRLTVPVD